MITLPWRTQRKGDNSPFAAGWLCVPRSVCLAGGSFPDKRKKKQNTIIWLAEDLMLQLFSSRIGWGVAWRADSLQFDTCKGEYIMGSTENPGPVQEEGQRMDRQCNGPSHSSPSCNPLVDLELQINTPVADGPPTPDCCPRQTSLTDHGTISFWRQTRI